MACTTRSPSHSRSPGSWPSQPYSSAAVVLGTVVAIWPYWLAAWPRPALKAALNAVNSVFRLALLTSMKGSW